MTTARQAPIDAPIPIASDAPPVDESVRSEIERRAYFRHCARGCPHGLDVDDWLAGEQDVLAERAAITA